MKDKEIGEKIKRTRRAGISRKSQVSIEMVSAIGIALFIFIFISFFAYMINSSKTTTEDMYRKGGLCLKISNMISELYIIGPGAEFNMAFDYDVAFESANSIFVSSSSGSEVFCRSPVLFTNGNSTSFTIHKGDVSLKNLDGQVVIQ
ncbi:MAG: hypothetical protein NT001_02945 [Candidatus Woesearchaeota archaeon]|nr:hypothetical protein [Candidatus Woesearchaeota archaeon]